MIVNAVKLFKKFPVKFHLNTKSVVTMNTVDCGSKWPLAAVCQMTATADKANNLKVCRQLISKASKGGARMVFLPEAFDYIAENKEESVKMSESLNGDTITQMKDIAKHLKIWLSLGGFHQKNLNEGESRIRNSHVVIDDKGEIVEVYDKVHLFDVNLGSDGSKGGVVQLKESAHTIRGERIAPPVTTPIGRVGLGICYDLRFPEMSLGLKQMGVEILTFPSAFTVVTGRAHWEVLIRNRAIDNQCYVVAAAQVGQHNAKRMSYGHAMIVDPWGKIVASCDDEVVDVAFAEINLDYLRKIRTEMPIDEHRRRDLYGAVTLSSDTSCKINSRDAFSFGPFVVDASQIFLRSPLSLAFVNIKPVVPGHVLVAPLRSVKKLADLSPTEVTDLFVCVQRVQRLVEKEYESSSSTVSIQDGPDAGQTVPHVHVHVLPRKKGDFDRNDDIYHKLEKHDKVDDGRSSRSADEMASEAEKLRKLIANC